MNMTLRDWATPLTIGSFMVLAVTGVLMFFHLDAGLNKLAHEWLSWAMLAAVGLHVAMHAKSFKRYFTRPATLAVIGVFAALLAASFITPSGPSARPPHVLAAQAILDAPLERVAALNDADVAALIGRLRAAGIAADARQTLRQAAGPQRDRQMKALATVFAP